MRKTATYVTCDAPDCDAVAEIFDEAKDAPEGWYHVMPAYPTNNGAFTYNRSTHFEFHRLQCLEKWTRERRKVLEPKSEVITHRASADTIEDTILAGIDLIEDEWASVAAIANVTGYHTSTVRRYAFAMEEAGLVESMEAKSPKNQPMYLFKRKTDDVS